MGIVRAGLRLFGVVFVTIPVVMSLLLGRLLGLVDARITVWIEDRITRFWSLAMVRILGLRLRVLGQAPQPPFFLVSNHLSYLDIVLLYAQVNGRFLAKSEVSRWPVMGMVTKSAGTLFIDRKRHRDLSRVLPEIEALLASGRGIMVFPEGTSTQGDSVQRFKPSFFEVPIRAGLPVSCVALSYRTPAGAAPARSAVCWWDDTPFASHFFKLLTLPSIEATVAFGDAALTGDDRKELALQAQQAVESQFTPVPGIEA